MGWKKVANGWINKNTKSNPQNNLPMFTGNLKFNDDVLQARARRGEGCQIRDLLRLKADACRIW